MDTHQKVKSSRKLVVLHAKAIAPVIAPAMGPVMAKRSHMDTVLDGIVDLDLNQMGANKALQLIGDVAQIPVFANTPLDAEVNIKSEGATIRDVIAEIVAQAGATQREDSVLAVGEGSLTLPHGQPIDLVLDDVTLDQAVQALAAALGQRIWVSHELRDDKVSVSAINQPAGDVLIRLLASKQLGLARIPAVVVSRDQP
jgi:hypothetical protein